MNVDTPHDIASEMADKLGIYGEERCWFEAELADRIRGAVHNEDRLKASGVSVYP